jgi:hypothetical protein
MLCYIFCSYKKYFKINVLSKKHIILFTKKLNVIKFYLNYLNVTAINLHT